MTQSLPFDNALGENYHPSMEKEKLKVQVLDVGTGQSLFECSLEESDRAHEFAASMEEMGLDVKVINPTLSETLTSSLGLSMEETKEYQESMDHELEDHDSSCCKTLH